MYDPRYNRMINPKMGHQQLGYDNLNQAALLASPMINIPPISSPMSPISPGSPIS